MKGLKLLSERTLSCLRQSGVRDLGQIVTMTAEQLLSLPGFDTTALSEVEQALASISIKLNQRPQVSRKGRPARPLSNFIDTGVLATPIQAVFEHESRVRNAMLRSRIQTLGQLVRSDELALLGLSNFGRTCLAIVKDTLAGYKLHLGMTEAQILAVLGREPKPAKQERAAATPIAATPARKPIPDAGILTISIGDAFESDTRARNALIGAGIMTLGALVRQQETDLFRIKGFGRSSLLVVQQLLTKNGLRLGMAEDYLQSMSRAFAANGKGQSSAQNIYGVSQDELPKGNIVKHINHFLGELDERDRQLVAFYFHSGQKRTLEKTGKRFRLTRERVRQLIARSCQRLARVLSRSGIPETAAILRNYGGYSLPSDKSIPMLCVPNDAVQRDGRVINSVAEYLAPGDAVYFDLEYAVWRLGHKPIEDRIRKLKTELPVLATSGEIRDHVARILGLRDSSLPVVGTIAATYTSREMIALSGTEFFSRKKASKQALVEETLRRIFPGGAHFSKIAAAIAGMSKRLEPRNAHATLTLNPRIILWGRGEFRHKDTIKLHEVYFSELRDKIDAIFQPHVTTVTAHAVFERYKSLAVQAGVPNPVALYASLEWRYPQRYLYRHYPDIESLKATRRPKIRRVEEFEAILADSDGPLSVEEIKERMGNHRRLMDHQIVQRLPESRCVLLYDSGCYVHESVLGIALKTKSEIQSKTREYLSAGVGYTTTKQIRLALELPPLKLPWTLRLLGSILEQDPAMTRIYNIVALGTFDSWDSLLSRIIRDSIGKRPGITLDDLNDSLISREFISVPLTVASFSRLREITISEGYIRVRA